MRRLLPAALAAAVALFPGAAFAQAGYPAKPIRIINGFAPGGTFDYLARMLGQRISDANPGWKFVVESKTGADGRIGSQECAKAAPDGYTFCIGGASTHAIHAAIFRTLPYDVTKDFLPVALVGPSANVIAVNPELPVKSIRELVALAKAQPGKLSFASAGTGTSTHLAGEMFKDVAGIDLLHVPFKGGAPAITAVVGNQVPILSDNVSTVAPHVQAGRLRAIAVTSIRRQPNLPDVPTLDESGLRGFDVGLWYAFFAPVGIPREAAQRFHAEINRQLGQAEVRELLEKRGIEARPLGMDEFAAFQRAEIARYAAIAAKAKITVE